MTSDHITPGDGFVWVTAYPKSGSTWLRLAPWSLKHGGAAPDFDVLDQGWLTMASNRALFDRSLGLDSAWLTDDEASSLRPAAFARRLTAEPGLHLLIRATLRPPHCQCLRHRTSGQPVEPFHGADETASGQMRGNPGQAARIAGRPSRIVDEGADRHML
jgi:hypothetical protein